MIRFAVFAVLFLLGLAGAFLTTDAAISQATSGTDTTAPPPTTEPPPITTTVPPPPPPPDDPPGGGGGGGGGGGSGGGGGNPGPGSGGTETQPAGSPGPGPSQETGRAPHPKPKVVQHPKHPKKKSDAKTKKEVVVPPAAPPNPPGPTAQAPILTGGDGGPSQVPLEVALLSLMALGAGVLFALAATPLRNLAGVSVRLAQRRVEVGMITAFLLVGSTVGFLAVFLGA